MFSEIIYQFLITKACCEFLMLHIYKMSYFYFNPGNSIFTVVYFTPLLMDYVNIIS